jgi:hypothetical protein
MAFYGTIMKIDVYLLHNLRSKYVLPWISINIINKTIKNQTYEMITMILLIRFTR